MHGAGVIDDQIEDDPHAPLMSRLGQFLQILFGSVAIGDLVVVRRVVAVIAHGFKHGHQPERLDAQVLQIVDIVRHSVQRFFGAELFDERLIDDGFYVPGFSGGGIRRGPNGDGRGNETCKAQAIVFEHGTPAMGKMRPRYSIRARNGSVYVMKSSSGTLSHGLTKSLFGYTCITRHNIGRKARGWLAGSLALANNLARRMLRERTRHTSGVAMPPPSKSATKLEVVASSVSVRPVSFSVTD